MYSGRVLVGFWLDRLQLDAEIQQKYQEKLAKGQLPHQRIHHLVLAFGQPQPLPPAPALPATSPCSFLRFGQRVQLHCPELLDQSYKFASQFDCPDEKKCEATGEPRNYGLVLAATVGQEDLEAGVRGIQDGCALACTPRKEPAARSVFALRPTSGCGADGEKDEGEGEYFCLGREFFLQLAHASESLYLRSETPRVDGQFGPRDHNPLRLSPSRDCYAKWRAVHWDRRRRIETEGAPVPPCMRLVVQHVMTGECLAAESLAWHRSLLGYECGASVHTYRDVHRDEQPECIWNLLAYSSSSTS